MFRVSGISRLHTGLGRTPLQRQQRLNLRNHVRAQASRRAVNHEGEDEIFDIISGNGSGRRRGQSNHGTPFESTPLRTSKRSRRRSSVANNDDTWRAQLMNELNASLSEIREQQAEREAEIMNQIEEKLSNIPTRYSFGQLSPIRFQNRYQDRSENINDASVLSRSLGTRLPVTPISFKPPPTNNDATRTPKRKFKGIDNYRDGSSGSIRIWIREFELMASTNGWNEQICLDELPQYLKGTAKNWWFRVGKDITTWKNMVNALYQEFSSAAYRQAMFQQVMSCVQEQDESVQQFADRFEQLYQESDFPVEEDILVNWFINALHLEIGSSIRYTRNAPFLDVVKEAVLTESNLALRKARPRMSK